MSAEAQAPDGRPWPVVIGRATRRELLSIVDEHLPRFREREALLVLRHPHLSAEVVEAVLVSRTLLAHRSVRKAVARTPLAPRPAALECLADLPWRDLLDVGRDARTPPPVRRAANQKLLERLPRLSLGERIALARLADRPILPALLEDRDARVFTTLLRNPRLVADDLMAWATVGEPRAEHLALLAADPVWMQRRELRFALVRSRRTPRPAALALLSSLSREEWRALSEAPAADPLVAACAEGLLSGRGRAEVVDSLATCR